MTRFKRSFIALAVLSLAGCVAGSNSNSAPNAATGTGASASPAVSVTPTSMPSPVNSTGTPSATETPHHFDDADVEAAVSVIREYYAAINAHDYRNAYELWSGKGEASDQSFADFTNGFAETASVNLSVSKPGVIEGAAGSRYINIPVTLRAKMADGRAVDYSGEYVLRRSVVDGATDDQKAWRISSAKLKKK